MHAICKNGDLCDEGRRNDEKITDGNYSSHGSGSPRNDRVRVFLGKRRFNCGFNCGFDRGFRRDGSKGGGGSIVRIREQGGRRGRSGRGVAGKRRHDRGSRSGRRRHRYFCEKRRGLSEEQNGKELYRGQCGRWQRHGRFRAVPQCGSRRLHDHVLARRDVCHLRVRPVCAQPQYRFHTACHVPGRGG